MGRGRERSRGSTSCMLEFPAGIKFPKSLPEDLIWVHPTHFTLSSSCREAGKDLSLGNSVVSGMESLGGKCHKQSCSWLSFPGEREMEKKQSGHPRNSIWVGRNLVLSPCMVLTFHMTVRRSNVFRNGIFGRSQQRWNLK